MCGDDLFLFFFFDYHMLVNFVIMRLLHMILQKQNEREQTDTLRCMDDAKFEGHFEQRNLFLRLWTSMCLLRLAFWVNAWLHSLNGHTNGRSPVCTRRWSKKLCHFRKNISQPSWSHLSIFTTRCVLGFLYLKIRNYRVSGIASSIFRLSYSKSRPCITSTLVPLGISPLIWASEIYS